MAGWKPWAALRERAHITLRFAPLVDEYGYIEDHGDGTRTIVLADDLDFVERNATLSHELAHEEMDLLYEASDEPRIVQKYELWADRRSTDLLVPPAELVAFVDATQHVTPVRAEEVAERFQVPLEVALDALRRMPAF